MPKVHSIRDTWMICFVVPLQRVLYQNNVPTCQIPAMCALIECLHSPFRTPLEIYGLLGVITSPSLVDPYILKEEGEIPENRKEKDENCHGYGRYFLEHWVWSHHASNPCDLHDGKEWTWDYKEKGIPQVPFTNDTQKAAHLNYCHWLHTHWYPTNIMSSGSDSQRDVLA